MASDCRSPWGCGTPAVKGTARRRQCVRPLVVRPTGPTSPPSARRSEVVRSHPQFGELGCQGVSLDQYSNPSPSSTAWSASVPFHASSSDAETTTPGATALTRARPASVRASRVTIVTRSDPVRDPLASSARPSACELRSTIPLWHRPGSQGRALSHIPTVASPVGPGAKAPSSAWGQSLPQGWGGARESSCAAFALELKGRGRSDARATPNYACLRGTSIWPSPPSFVPGESSALNDA